MLILQFLKRIVKLFTKCYAKKFIENCSMKTLANTDALRTTNFSFAVIDIFEL